MLLRELAKYEVKITVAFALKLLAHWYPVNGKAPNIFLLIDAKIVMRATLFSNIFKMCYFAIVIPILKTLDFFF